MPIYNHGNGTQIPSMFIDYGLKEKVVIAMYEFINDLLSKLPTDMDCNVYTPVSSHLFNVNPESTKLVEKQSIFFHHFVAKLLTICKHKHLSLHSNYSRCC